jgi:hypothetical protein
MVKDVTVLPVIRSFRMVTLWRPSQNLGTNCPRFRANRTRLNALIGALCLGTSSDLLIIKPSERVSIGVWPMAEIKNTSTATRVS